MGQQFVLEAVVVAIVLVSTIVLVTEMQPGQPGLSQPRTHDRLRSTAQDTLNNLAAQDVPACHEDLPACMQGNKLSLEVYQAAVNGDDALCRRLASGFPEGVRLDVTVNTPIAQRRVCGEAPPDEAGVASESANQPITLAFNYVHLFTDMDVYNGQDEVALDTDILTEDQVASIEKRADQRVWAAPIWKSRPVAPGGAALEATVEIEGEDAILTGGESLIGEREFFSASWTQEGNETELPFASMYARNLTWCRPWSQTGCDDEAPSIVDRISYDQHLDDRYFGQAPNQTTVDFQVVLNETAGTPVEAGTGVVCKVPADWNVVDVSGNAAFDDKTEDKSGSPKYGWTVTAETDEEIQDATPIPNATLTITAKPPNPSNLQTTDDPHTPVYAFRCWLEDHAQSTLDLAVHLDPSDVSQLPATSGILVTISAPSPMDTDEAGWYGVTVHNPTIENATVTSMTLRAKSDRAVFERLNLSNAFPGGNWQTKGLQGEDEKIDNGDFEDGLAGWGQSRWPANISRDVAVATDSLGFPHVAYSRDSDDRLVHLWMTRDADGRPVWHKDLVPGVGTVGEGSLAIDDNGTLDDAGDDVVHLVFAGLEDDNTGASFSTMQNMNAPDLGGGSGSGDDEAVYHVSRAMGDADADGSGSWTAGDVDTIRDVDDARGFQARVMPDGGVEVLYWRIGASRIFVQRSDGGLPAGVDSDDCNGGENWSCGSISTDGPVHGLDVATRDGARHLAFKQDVGSDSANWRLAYCAWPCDKQDAIADGLKKTPPRSFGLALGRDGTPSVAFLDPSEGLRYGERVGSGCGVGSETNWTCETIEDDTALSDEFWVDVGMTANGTRTEIAYARRAAVDPLNQTTLYHAFQESPGEGCVDGTSGWTCEAVGDTGSGWRMATARGPGGRLHVAHLGAENSSITGQVQYAASRLAPGSWAFEGGATDPIGEVLVGAAPSADRDADGNVHVSYYDETTETLWYATDENSDDWHLEVVDTASPWTGWRSDIAIVGDKPAIAYYKDDELWYAERDTGGTGCAVGGNWTCTKIADSAYPPSGNIEPYSIDLDLTVASDDTVGIAFQGPDSSLFLAVDDAEVTADVTCPGTESSGWECVEVEEGVSYDPAASVMTDENGNKVFRVGYYDTGTDLWIATVKKASLIGGDVDGGYALAGTSRPEDTGAESGGNVRLTHHDLGVEPGDRVWGIYGMLPATREYREKLRVFANVSLDPGEVDVDCTADFNDQPEEWTCETVDDHDWFGRGDLVGHDGQLHGLAATYDHPFNPDGPAKWHYYNFSEADPCQFSTTCEDLGLDFPNSEPAGEAVAAMVVHDRDPQIEPWMFAKKDGDLMVFMRDSGGCDYSVDSDWSCEVVDNGSLVPRTQDPAIAVDGALRPHVVGHEPLRDSLLYSKRDDIGWSTEIVDNGSTPRPSGKQIAAVWSDDGDVHAVYKAEINATATELRYGTNATGWDSVELAGDAVLTDLALDSHGDVLHLGLVNKRGSNDYIEHWTCTLSAATACLDGANWSSTDVVNASFVGGMAMSVRPDGSPDGSPVFGYHSGGGQVEVAREQSGDDSCNVDGWNCSLAVTNATAFDVAAAEGRTAVAWANGTECDPDDPDLDNPDLDCTASYYLNVTEDTGSGFGDNETVDRTNVTDDSATGDNLADPDRPGYGPVRVAYNGDVPTVASRRVAPATEDDDVPLEILHADRAGDSWDVDVVGTTADSSNLVMPGLTLGDPIPGATAPTVAAVVEDDNGERLILAKDEVGSDSCPDVDANWDCRTLGSRRDTTWRSLSLNQSFGVDRVAADARHLAAFEVFDVGSTISRVDKRLNPNVEEGDVGFYGDVALSDRAGDDDVRAVPHIAYHDHGPYNESLKYATLDDEGNWNVTEVQTAGISGVDAQIEYGRIGDESGPMIAHWDLENQLLRFAWYDGEWHHEVVNGTADGWPTTGNLSMSLDDFGRPWIAFQTNASDAGDRRQVAVAVRDDDPHGTCGAGTHSAWNCTTVDGGTDPVDTRDVGYGTGLAVADQGAGDDTTLLYDHRGALDDHDIWAANRTGSLNCERNSDNWTWRCGNLATGSLTPISPSIGTDLRGGHWGLFVKSLSTSDETLSSTHGARKPVDAELYSATDTRAVPEPTCLDTEWECKVVHDGDEVARPDVTTHGDVAYAAVEDATLSTFLYGATKGWGNVTVRDGIRHATVSDGGSQAFQASRSCTQPAWAYENASIHQTFFVPPGRDMSAAILEFNASKAISGETADLRLDKFSLNMSVQRISPEVGPVDNVWTEPTLDGTDWQFSRVPVTANVSEPGQYLFRASLEVRCQMKSEGASATVEALVDDLSLVTYENRLVPLENPAFRDTSDWMGYRNGSQGWELTDDGAWTADSRFGESRTEQDFDDEANGEFIGYSKIWNASQRPDGLFANRHAAAEATTLTVWEACFTPCRRDPSDPVDGLVNNSFHQNFTLDPDRDPTRVQIDAKLWHWTAAYDSDPGSFDIPDCRKQEAPQNDPCSGFYDEPGAPGDPTNINSHSDIRVRLTLRNETGDAVHLWRNRSADNICSNACPIQQWDVTNFVQSTDPADNNYTLEIYTEFEFKAEQPGSNDFADQWLLYQVVTGLDDFIVQADYQGGSTVTWTGSQTVDAKSSEDWVFKAKGNGIRTAPARERIEVPLDYTNDDTFHGQHMKRYGLYQRDLRPENVTCDVSGCEGQGGGFDSDDQACVHVNMTTSGRSGRMKGKQCYANDDAQAMTLALETAARDASVVVVENGTGRYNRIDANCGGQSEGKVKVRWNFTKVEDALQQMDADLPVFDLDTVDVVTIRFHAPSGEMAMEREFPRLAGSHEFEVCGEPAFFLEGAYAVEGTLNFTGTTSETVEQTVRKVDAFYLNGGTLGTSAPGAAPSLPVYDLQLRAWWRPT